MQKATANKRCSNERRTQFPRCMGKRMASAGTTGGRVAYATERTLVGQYVSVSVRTKECLAPLTASFHLKLHEWTSCPQLTSAAAPGFSSSTATLPLTFNHS